MPSEAVGPVMVRPPARQLGTREFARAEQQGIDLGPVPPGIQSQENPGRAVGHGLRRREGVAQPVVDGAGGP